eukprot:IDg7846t1
MLELEHNVILNLFTDPSLAALPELSRQLSVLFSHLGVFAPARRVTIVGAGTGREKSLSKSLSLESDEDEPLICVV